MDMNGEDSSGLHSSYEASNLKVGCKHCCTQVTPIRITLQYDASCMIHMMLAVPFNGQVPSSLHLVMHTPVTPRLAAEAAGLTFSFTVSTVLVILFSQQFGQNGLMLLIQFLGFFSLRPRRHVAKVRKLDLPVKRRWKPRSAQPVLKRVGHHLLLALCCLYSVSLQPASEVIRICGSIISAAFTTVGIFAAARESESHKWYGTHKEFRVIGNGFICQLDSNPEHTSNAVNWKHLPTIIHRLSFPTPRASTLLKLRGIILREKQQRTKDSWHWKKSFKCPWRGILEN